jgi:hypothetical protein
MQKRFVRVRDVQPDIAILLIVSEEPRSTAPKSNRTVLHSTDDSEVMEPHIPDGTGFSHRKLFENGVFCVVYIVIYVEKKKKRETFRTRKLNLYQIRLASPPA